jgi:hypothetical protein
VADTNNKTTSIYDCLILGIGCYCSECYNSTTLRAGITTDHGTGDYNASGASPSEIWGYSDDSGSQITNINLRRERAVRASHAFIPTLEGRRANWVKHDDPLTTIRQPINVKLAQGAPADYYLADNNTALGRTRNRAVLIREIAMHDVVEPGSIWLSPEDERSKLAQISAAIDNFRDSSAKSHRFRVKAFDLWTDPTVDLRILTEHNVTMAIADNTDPEFNEIRSSSPVVGKNPLNYVTDYRLIITADLRNARKNNDTVLLTLENLFRQLFGGIARLTRDLDQVAGPSNNSLYISTRLRDWMMSQQMQRGTAYNAALELEE